jgi:hypothetical protein
VTDGTSPTSDAVAQALGSGPSARGWHAQGRLRFCVVGFRGVSLTGRGAARPAALDCENHGGGHAGLLGSRGGRHGPVGGRAGRGVRQGRLAGWLAGDADDGPGRPAKGPGVLCGPGFRVGDGAAPGGGAQG